MNSLNLKVADMMHYKIKNISKMKPTILHLMNDIQASYTLSEEKFFEIRLVVSELIMNAFEHGKKNHHVDIFLDRGYNLNKIKVTVEDYGEGFSFAAVKEDSISEDLYKSGGRGIQLVKALCDNVTYNDIGNKVSVVMSV